MANQGMAATMLHLQHAILSTVNSRLQDAQNGSQATIAKYGIPWVAGTPYPLQLHDEAPPGIFPFLQFGALTVDSEGGEAVSIYNAAVDLDVVTLAVMGRAQALALASIVEQALMITDAARDSRWSADSMELMGANNAMVSSRAIVIDHRVQTVTLITQELSGQLVYVVRITVLFEIEDNAA